MLRLRRARTNRKSLNAGIERFSDILITDSPGTIANLIMNKTRPFRFLYNREADRYAIGEALNCYHSELAIAIWKLGYPPYFKNYNDVNEDEDCMVQYIFMPNTKEWENEIDDAEDFEGVGAHYTPALKLTVGNLYYASEGNFNIQEDDPYLYQALKARRLIER